VSNVSHFGILKPNLQTLSVQQHHTRRVPLQPRQRCYRC
jgi:hypothetical protein